MYSRQYTVRINVQHYVINVGTVVIVMSKILDVSPAIVGSSVEGRTAVGGNLASGAAAGTELAWPAPPVPCYFRHHARPRLHLWLLYTTPVYVLG